MPYNILAVDDEMSSDHVKQTIDHLKHHGFVVTQCGTVAEAMDLFRNGGQFDLVLLDVDMGAGPTGLSLYESIRALPDGNAVPILIYTKLAIIPDLADFLKSDPLLRVAHKPRVRPTQLPDLIFNFTREAGGGAAGPQSSNPEPAIDSSPVYYAKALKSEARVPMIFFSAVSSDALQIRIDWNWPIADIRYRRLIEFHLGSVRSWPQTFLLRLSDRNKDGDFKDNTIQGILVILGVPDDRNRNSCFFESSPINRYSAGETRQFRWVGKVLVAHLINENRARGGNGRIVITDNLAGSFLVNIGFRRCGDTNNYYLRTDDADKIVADVT